VITLCALLQLPIFMLVRGSIKWRRSPSKPVAGYRNQTSHCC